MLASRATCMAKSHLPFLGLSLTSWLVTCVCEAELNRGGILVKLKIVWGQTFGDVAFGNYLGIDTLNSCHFCVPCSKVPELDLAPKYF